MLFKYFCLVIIILQFKRFDTQECSKVSTKDRLDCAPDKPSITNDECSKRKCCFNKSNSSNVNADNVPNCFMPTDYVGYKVKDIKKESSQISVTLERQIASGFPKDVNTVSVSITFLNDKSLRVRLIDEKEKRWEPPIPHINLPKSTIALNPLYDVDVSKDGLLTIKRKSNGKTIFSTELQKLIYSDQFLQLKSSLSSTHVYGIGEHKDKFLRNSDWQIYTLFNRDTAPKNDWPLYGSHAFHLNIEDQSTGLANGVYLLNSNAMDVLLQPEPAITWRPIGGILDLFVFLGSKPADVVSEYINLIGKPAIPPFWALGYHQCRCCPAPKTLAEQKVIWKRTRDAGIPFDVQWNAKEYMVGANDFTLNNEYADLGKWIEELHQLGMHYVPIIDPGIDPGLKPGTYPPFDDGVKLDIFIKNSTDKLQIGKVWNHSGKTVWPDFSHPSAREYWLKQFRDFYKLVPIDGAWNDMNEVSNSVAGSKYGCADTALDNPQYALRQLPKIHDKTICMSSKHHAGVEYNMHNLYAFYMAIATDDVLREIRQKRSLIISRATFPGQGKYSGHWDGDTFTTYDEMQWTIPSIMNMNMFGIPLVGGDICGFQGGAKNDTNFQDLCARWLEIGAFYPFSRNHNTKSVDQDPVALGQTVTRAAKNALETRYSLLPYLYTLFYFAKSEAQTVARSLFFEYPTDKNAYGPASETQFMWGSALMIAPVTEPDKTSVNAYLPAGRWYPYSANTIGKAIESNGKSVEFKAPVDTINTFLVGGSVVPIFEPRQTTTEMRKQDFTAVVVLCSKYQAGGNLYWDDGDSIDPVESEHYTLVSFSVENGTLSTKPEHNKYEGKVVLDKLVVMGLKEKPTSVTVNGKSTAFTFDANTDRLDVKSIQLDLKSAKHSIVWK